MTTLEKHAAAIDQQKGEDLKEAVAKLREANPRLTLEDAFAMLRKSRPDLFEDTMEVYHKAVKASSVVFRYTGKKSTTPWRVKTKVEAKEKPKDDGGGEVMLVYGSDGEIAGLELVRGDHQEVIEKKTQKLLDATPGLHRDVARHLVRDSHPGLDDEVGEGEKLAASQMEIKSRIKAMQLRDPKKSFRQCWESLQRSNPELFEPLPEA